MTEREFSGWVPAERHVHYAADEVTVTGYTVVERESRIDDADRVELLALMQHDAEVGPCGYHPVIATDPENVFTPETQKCPVCAAMAVWERVLNEQDTVPHDAPAKQPRPSDGRHSFMRWMTPEQAEAAQAKASPPRT